MRAVTISRPGGPEVLVETDLPDPVPAHGEVLIEVAAAGVNRADVHQREGGYPPPSGAPDWPGLEVSGIVSALGDGVTDVALGDRVCALLPGGGYAELAIATAGQVLPVPETIDLVEAAALPEAIATVWSNVFMTASLRAGETLLVHGGSSGIGTMAIQLARAVGCQVAVTAGTPAKLEACARLGANILIDYREQDFVDELLEATDGRGADVVLDAIGGDYLDRNIRALARHGRIVLIGNQSRAKGVLDVGRLMARWGSVHGSTLRARPLAEKNEIIASVLANAWPLVASGQVVPVVDERFPLAEARRAHEKLESSAHIGKLLLVPNDAPV
jgi:putative PIG3 family NAD(P)H quinone oxidoreductase